MGEPCKKKPRKSKLVPCTYQDLQDNLKKQDTPPDNIKFSVNVEVEECDEDWFQKMLDEEKNQKTVRGVKSLRKVKSAKGRQSSDGQTDSQNPGPSEPNPNKEEKKDTEIDAENKVEIKVEELPQDSTTEASQDESSQEGTVEVCNSLEEQLPAFQISKIFQFGLKDGIDLKMGKEAENKMRKRKRSYKNMKKDDISYHLTQSEHHYPAVDKTVVFCEDSISNYYHTVIEDAIVLSPYTSSSSYKKKLAEVRKYVCESCNFFSRSQKELEHHLETDHPNKDVYIFVKPNKLVASKNMPKDECFLADVHFGHMVYYCSDYNEAIYTLVTKWNLTANADQRRKPGVLSYKCYPCRFQYEYFRDFEKHLNDFHQSMRIVITSEFLAPSHMSIAAGGNILTQTINMKSSEGYQCFKCKKKISSLLLLEQHTKHDISCEGCEISLPCDELQTHQGFCEKYLNSYFPKTCPCKKVFHTYQQQNVHRNFCKFGRSTIAYHCLVCKYMAPSIYILYQHQITEHHVWSDVFADVKVRKCDKCKDKFVDSDYHACENEAGVKCVYCGLNFNNEKFLDLHQKVYDKVGECDKCDYESAKSCQLIEHNATKHDGIHKIVYECPICKVEFATQQDNNEEAHSKEIHEKATWGGVTMELRKICVLKDPKSLVLYKDDDGATSQTKSENRPALNETDINNSEIIIRPMNAQKTTKQMKVYGSKVPKELEKMIKTIKIAVPKQNPVGLQVKVRSATELKALENSKQPFLPSVRKTENRSLLKNISDKIVFDDDNDVEKALKHKKEAKHQNKEINKSDLVEIGSMKADFIVSNPDQDFKINEILMCISKNTKNDSTQIVSDDDDVDMKFGDITNDLIEAKTKKCGNSSQEVDNSNEKDICLVEDAKESIEKVIQSTETLEAVTVKQEIDTDFINEENDETVSDDIKTTNETFEMAKDIPKSEIEITDNIIDPDNIKKEVIDIITNIKNEDPGEGCSYSEVSLSNVFQISKHLLETDVEIKSEPDFNQDDMMVEDSLLTPIVEKTVVCKCGYTVPQREYKKHKATCQEHKRNLTYKCSKCELECLDLRDYLKHLPSHGFKKFQCPSCHEIQQNNQKFAEHVLQHIKSGFRKITYIDKNDKNQTKKFRCNQCRSIFAQNDFFLHWQTHFNAHIVEETVEKPETTKPTAITNEEKIKMIDFITDPKKTLDRQCIKCDHKFARHNDMKRHYIEHLLSHAYSKKTVFKELRCQICAQGFDKADMYKKHMRDHALLPLYQCQICDKAFSDSSNFGKHKKVHDLHTSVCDICNKKFQCKTMLKKHLEAHTKSKPVNCELCRKTFYFESAFKKHKKHAHGDQTYACKICKDRFASCKLKWEHEWEVHQERKFDADCPICNKGFRNYAATKNHMKAEHGVDSFIARSLVKKFMQIVGQKKTIGSPSE